MSLINVIFYIAQWTFPMVMENLELYPFVKTKARKTIIEPIIEKRLAEASEQKRLNDE